MSEFFAMGGYAAYVWSAYGLTLAVLIGNWWVGRRRLATELEALRRRRVAESEGEG